MFRDETQQLRRPCRLPVVKSHMDVCTHSASQLLVQLELVMGLAYRICSFLPQYRVFLPSSLCQILLSPAPRSVVVGVLLCRCAQKGSTGSKVDRRQGISGLESLRTSLMLFMIRVEGHSPGFAKYLAAPFKEDGCHVVSQSPTDSPSSASFPDLSCQAFLTQSICYRFSSCAHCL